MLTCPITQKAFSLGNSKIFWSFLQLIFYHKNGANFNYKNGDLEKEEEGGFDTLAQVINSRMRVLEFNP